MPNTLCPKLWYSLFIDKNGDVYGCCHRKPAVLGNIYKSSLKDIWNCELIKKYRKQALSGNFSCYNKCILLKSDPYLKISLKCKQIHVDYSELKHLIILFGYKCNIRCVMCFQNHLDKTALSLDSLMKNVDFSSIKHVDMLGGEPLAMNEVIKFFYYLCLNDIGSTFITNGTIMNDVLAKKIAINCPLIIISLNAATKKTYERICKGSNWEKVLQNIKQICSYKKRYKNKLIIHGHMTIAIQNLHEIPLFIKNYKKFGFNRIDFGFDNKTVPLFLKQHPAFKKSLSAIIKNEIKNKDPLKVITYRLKVLGLV